MKGIPTDLQLLNLIYDRYYDTYASYSEAQKNRSAKIFVPIDIEKLAGEIGIEDDIIFGRLYYHLEAKYGYKNDDGSHTHFFALAIGRDRHCINFPYMASVLANLREENRKYRLATSMSLVSLFIAIVSFLISILS